MFNPNIWSIHYYGPLGKINVALTVALQGKISTESPTEVTVK